MSEENIRKLPKKKLQEKMNELQRLRSDAFNSGYSLQGLDPGPYEREVDRRRDVFVSRRDLVLELVVIALIAGEIWMGFRQEGHQSKNFTDQQAILSTMNTKTGETATAMKDAAASLKMLSDDQKTANGNFQSTLDQTKSMAIALKQQLDILKQEQAARQAEQSKKPKLELFAGKVGTPEMVNLNTTASVSLPSREQTDTSQSFDFYLRNGGTASALNGMLRAAIFAPDVQLRGGNFQLVADEANTQGHVYTMNFERLRPGINIPIAITFTFPKGHEPFTILFNVDDDESDSGTLLGVVNLVPKRPSP
jgi:hypothetical protein